MGLGLNGVWVWMGLGLAWDLKDLCGWRGFNGVKHLTRLVLVGDIMSWNGFLLWLGVRVSLSLYPELFDVLHPQWGWLDGTGINERYYDGHGWPMPQTWCVDTFSSSWGAGTGPR